MPITLLKKLLKNSFVSSYKDADDEELMKQFIANDDQAFLELYDRYKTPLYSYYAGLVSSSKADDLLQETFLKFSHKKETFRFESKVKTWIWTIAKNTLRDHWRSLEHKMNNSLEELTSEEGEEIYSDESLSIEEKIYIKATKEQLKLCIDELTIEQKEIFLMYIQSELSYQEIARLNNLSIGATKSTINRTKYKIIDCFKSKGQI